MRQYSVDPNLGSAFALGVSRRDGAQVFAYVDDSLSTCTILTTLSSENGVASADASGEQ